MDGKFKKAIWTQKKVPKIESLINLLVRLFHQHHLAGLAAKLVCKAIEIDTAGDFVAMIVITVPNNGIFAILSISVEEGFDLLTTNVINIELAVCACGHVEADGRFGVEGVRIVLAEHVHNGGCSSIFHRRTSCGNGEGYLQFHEHHVSTIVLAVCRWGNCI